VRPHRLFVLLVADFQTMTIQTNLAENAAQLGTLSETDRNVVSSRSPSATTIAPTPVALLTQAAQDPASPGSQPNQEVSQMPTMASARRRQSAITDHFRGVTSHRTTPRHTSSRRATITPGSMPRYPLSICRYVRNAEYTKSIVGLFLY
jgi:hypothetical protein